MTPEQKNGPEKNGSRPFPSACRRFLSLLPDALDRDGSADLGHADECPRCARQLRSARRQAEMLGTPPDVPAALRDRSFLDAIYERAGERSRAVVGPMLEEAMVPAHAPADVVWRDPGVRPDLASSLRQLPPVRTPGWLWSRIRSDITATSAPRRTRGVVPEMRTLHKSGLVAAAALVCGALISGAFLFDNHPRKDGTAPSVSFVWNVKTEPIEASLSMRPFARIGR